MRELTISEMEQVNGGFVLGVAAGCGSGAVTGSSPLGAIMGCAGGTASSLAIVMATMSGPVGAVVLVGVGIGVAYATHRAQEYIEDIEPYKAPEQSS